MDKKKKRGKNSEKFVSQGFGICDIVQYQYVHMF